MSEEMNKDAGTEEDPPHPLDDFWDKERFLFLVHPLSRLAGHCAPKKKQKTKNKVVRSACYVPANKSQLQKRKAIDRANNSQQKIYLNDAYVPPSAAGRPGHLSWSQGKRSDICTLVELAWMYEIGLQISEGWEYKDGWNAA